VPRPSGDARVEQVAPAEAPVRRVVVAVLTYDRDPDLRELLPLLLAQCRRASHPSRVLVVDNSPNASARDVVRSLHGGSRLDYVHEPSPGIPAARNRALDEAADDDVLVFLDDDERPGENWLDVMLATFDRHPGSCGVVGPVRSEFTVPLSPWVEAGRFFDRRRLASGTPVEVAATNNLLLDLERVRSRGLRFDDRFRTTGGSDTLFTRQLTAGGDRLVWCAEAMVVDRVPPERTTARWVLRRAYRLGNSWTVTRRAGARSPSQRWRLRGRLLVAGTGRVVVGTVTAAAGWVLRSRRHQARGLRLAARGLGLAGGCVGVHYHEYRRRPGAGRGRPGAVQR
jgi:succinoglycan biosynthesis protein ExoM